MISGVAHLKHLLSLARSSRFQSIYCKLDVAVYTWTLSTKEYYHFYRKFSWFNGYSSLHLVNSYINIWIYTLPIQSLKENFTLHFFKFSRFLHCILFNRAYYLTWSQINEIILRLEIKAWFDSKYPRVSNAWKHVSCLYLMLTGNEWIMFAVWFLTVLS